MCYTAHKFHILKIWYDLKLWQKVNLSSKFSIFNEQYLDAVSFFFVYSFRNSCTAHKKHPLYYNNYTIVI